MFFPICTVLPLEIIALRLFLPKCPNIFSSPFTGSIPKLKNMVPAGKKLGMENFEQLLRIAQRYMLGNQTEKMLADTLRGVI